MEKLIHTTSKEHYQTYATITGGEGKERLKKLVMDMIGGDVEALKEAYLEDKHLNNIDKVLKKAGTFAVITGYKPLNPTIAELVGRRKPRKNKYQEGREVMKEDFKKRCLENNCSTRLVEVLDRGGYPMGSWFLTFDLRFPEFVNYTREGRKKYAEESGKSGGVSPSCVVSGLKHVMIFDILGCEFVEEVR